jgi:hypothetical protein
MVVLLPGSISSCAANTGQAAPVRLAARSASTAEQQGIHSTRLGSRDVAVAPPPRGGCLPAALQQQLPRTSKHSSGVPRTMLLAIYSPLPPVPIQLL